MEYIECEGLPNVGYCSDNDCPCSVTQIQQGTGYLYISPEVIKFRRNALTQAECRKKLTRYTEKNEYLSLQQYEPILICHKGAKRRNLDLNIAAEDARLWWETQKAPLRATPFAIKDSAKSTIYSFQKSKKPAPDQIQKPVHYLENDYLQNSAKRASHDLRDESYKKKTSQYSKDRRTYTENEESSVDVVSQYAGTPLEELALKMNENNNTGYSKTDYSITDTAVPYDPGTDTFHQYDQSLLPPQPDGRRKRRSRKPSTFSKFIKNSTPVVLSVIITASLSFTIFKFADIKAYIIKKFENVLVFTDLEETQEETKEIIPEKTKEVTPEETQEERIEETIAEKPGKYKLTKDFFRNFYSFKDKRYYGTIKFSDVKNKSGYYEQEVIAIGKENKYIVTGSFAYNKEKIIFKPEGKNIDIVWMLQSLHLDSKTAVFYDPKRVQEKESGILLVQKEPSENEIVISTDPAEATVFLNDSILGQTPLSLKNPPFHGLYELTIEKEGYNTEKYELEYTGGFTEKHMVLTGIPDSTDQDIVSEEEVEKYSDTILSDSTLSFSEASEEPFEQTVTEEPFEQAVSEEPLEPTASEELREPTASEEPFEQTTSEEPFKQTIVEQDKNAGTIFLSSLPPNADVYMDGVKIGTTNADFCQITAGTHTMRFVKGDLELVRKMTFRAGQNPSLLVRLK